MQRLSGMDASFLYMETPTRPMHVVGLLTLDPAGMHGGFTTDRVKRLIQARIHLMPMLRRRLVGVPLGLNHPMWAEDPAFALDSHVQRVAVPRPGSPKELAELVGEFASRPLDRTRPLWEMLLVEGLADGSAALVTKMHHATIDGVTGADLMAHLLDLEPDATDPPPPEHEWVPDDIPGEIQMMGTGVLDRLTDPLEGVRALARTTRSAFEMVKGIAPIGSGRLKPALPFSGPRTMLNAPVTVNRAVALGQAELADFKAIKTAFGTTVNDVVLAATTQSLRRYLLAHDDLPDRPLIAAVPVSVHDRSEAIGINKVSNMFVRLPVDLDDPVEQLRAIHIDTKDAKAVHHAMGADLIQDLAQLTPPGVYNLAMRVYAFPQVSGALPPVQNLVVSNVPGPPIPLYIAGAQVHGIYPFGPLIEGSGINLTVLSNRGNIDIGVIACRDTVPDLWQVVEGFTEAVHHLRDAAAGFGSD
jgi:diacylglycerol O-acyltransferase / wax synthase